ncbi:HAD family phosphatase [Cryobacterium sp. MLB-32]|uniref:HAD family hydrolase n=1 Tax=Cryobacterium sp. MLB-32 TaxID=1529318 RepID=UPI00068C44BF|nr:HAD family phosphatase [Cryobacterium sp. MLB-32]
MTHTPDFSLSPDSLRDPLASGWGIADMHGLLLDFNGTLSDDERLLSTLIRALASESLGVTLSADRYITTFAGRSDSDILGALLRESTRPHAALETLVEQLAERYERAAASVQLISESTREFVRGAAALGLSLAVVTGANRQSVLSALRKADLDDLLSTVVAEEDVVHGKPHPEGFLRGAQLLGITDPRRIVVVEDSLPGIAAARAAGMRVLAVAGTHPDGELRNHADDVLPTLNRSVLTQRFDS